MQVTRAEVMGSHLPGSAWPLAALQADLDAIGAPPAAAFDFAALLDYWITQPASQWAAYRAFVARSVSGVSVPVLGIARPLPLLKAIRAALPP